MTEWFELACVTVCMQRRAEWKNIIISRMEEHHKKQNGRALEEAQWKSSIRRSTM